MKIAARPPLPTAARQVRAGASPRDSRPPAEPVVDIVIPVYNEEDDLELSVRRLDAFLETEFPWTARITIADNASADRTWEIAQRLSAELPRVEALHLDEKGRGRALRAAWSRSEAAVVAYMDVDLSTDLRALLPLVAPLLSGHSDVAIGSRLLPGSRVVRGPKRELISRSYNMLLRTVLRTAVHDAQCGFKALRAGTARHLLAQVEDQGFFFDTELLVLAERRGLRIHEVAVDWVDDPDSRVDIVATALADLRGVARLLRGHQGGLARQLGSFAVIGLVSTAAYAALYAALRGWAPATLANVSALLLTAVGNTAANRRLTFRVRDRAGQAWDHLGGLLAFSVALLLTSGALAVLSATDPRAGRRMEIAVLVAANAVATSVRFILLRGWIGRRAGLTAGPRP